MVMESLNAHIRLATVKYDSKGDGESSSEPMLWVVYFKIDGETCTVDGSLNLKGTVTISARSSMEWEGVKPGDSVDTPAIVGQDGLLKPGFSTTLRPIPLETPIFGVTHTGGVLGCLAVLIERDNTSNTAREAGRETLIEEFRKAINDIIPTIGISNSSVSDEQKADAAEQIGEAVKKKIEETVGFFGWVVGGFDMDDSLGSEIFMFKHDELVPADANSRMTSFSKSFSDKDTKGHGAWTMSGKVETSKIKKINIKCFVATATFGDENHPAVLALRRFRDEWLARRAWGRTFTHAYEQYSPPLAAWIARSSVRRKLSERWLVRPAAKVADYIMRKQK